jgi:hypothetical protein
MSRARATRFAASCRELQAPAVAGCSPETEQIALLTSRQVGCQLPDTHLCGCHFLPLDSRRVAPKIFQAVKGAFVAVKDMHNHLQIIEHHPLAGRKSVNRRRPNMVVFL